MPKILSLTESDIVLISKEKGSLVSDMPPIPRRENSEMENTAKMVKNWIAKDWLNLDASNYAKCLVTQIMPAGWIHSVFMISVSDYLKVRIVIMTSIYRIF